MSEHQSQKAQFERLRTASNANLTALTILLARRYLPASHSPNRLGRSLALPPITQRYLGRLAHLM